MAHWNRLPENIRAEIISAYKAGEKCDVTAARYGVGRATPRKIARGVGLPARPIRRKYPDKEAYRAAERERVRRKWEAHRAAALDLRR